MQSDYKKKKKSIFVLFIIPRAGWSRLQIKSQHLYDFSS